MAGGCPSWAGGPDVAMAGKATDQPALSPEDFAPMGAFMESFNKDLEESGELVETRALDV